MVFCSIDNGGKLWFLKITLGCGQNNSRNWQKKLTPSEARASISLHKIAQKKPVVSHTPPHHHFQMHVYVPAPIKPSNHQPSIFYIYTSHKNWRWWWMRRNKLFFCVKFNTNCTQFFGLIPYTFFNFQKVLTFKSLSLSFEFLSSWFLFLRMSKQTAWHTHYQAKQICFFKFSIQLWLNHTR